MKKILFNKAEVADFHLNASIRIRITFVLQPLKFLHHCPPIVVLPSSYSKSTSHVRFSPGQSHHMINVSTQTLLILSTPVFVELSVYCLGTSPVRFTLPLFPHEDQGKCNPKDRPVSDE